MACRVEGEPGLADENNENAPRIINIIVGTPDPFGDNFISRGDIIVDFTGERERIKRKLRRS